MVYRFLSFLVKRVIRPRAAIFPTLSRAARKTNAIVYYPDRVQMPAGIPPGRYIRNRPSRTTRPLTAGVSWCSCTVPMMFQLQLLASEQQDLGSECCRCALEFIPVAGWLTTFAAVVSVGTVSHTHWIWIVGSFAVVESASGLSLFPAYHGAPP